MSITFSLNETEKACLARLARLSIESMLTGRAQTAAPEQEAALAANDGTRSALFRPLGAFVTITLDGHLRGCIGTITGREPLYRTIWDMARSAAFEDPRFPPLTLRDWSGAKMHISVLDELSPCPDAQAVEVGRHGLALQHMGRSGVFLPQVPVEQGWDRLAYLDNLCLKAGLPSGSWKAPGARLFWYEALVFPA